MQERATPSEPTYEATIAVKLTSGIRGIPINVIARNILIKTIDPIAPMSHKAANPRDRHILKSANGVTKIQI
jgi:hypothetical protein